MKKHALFLLTCTWLIHYQVNAQSIGPSTFNAAGGSNTIAGNTYEWSLGEMTLVSTFTGTGIIVTQGVLQPGPIPNGIDGIFVNDGSLKAYPNPVSDLVNIQTDMKSPGSLTMQLYDATGKFIMQQNADQKTGKELHQLSMNRYAAGQYTLRVIYASLNGTYYSSFKLQKTN
jgi:hypothetical protein